LNKVVLIGRLTKDPDLKFAAGSGKAVTRFTLAVNRDFKKDGQQEADFINCVAFDKRAEAIANYLTKGRLVAVTGRIQTGSYDKDGVKHYTTDIMVDGFEFLEKKQDSTSNAGSSARQANGNDSGKDDYIGEPIYGDDIPF
jgi:single-strand DNA-binding protein